MKLYLASGNVHKKQEMVKICPNHEIIIPKDRGIEFDPEETGSTFIENALIKAKSLWEIVQEPVLADDSGISVEALGGLPGIYSARYEGKKYPQGRINKNSDLTQLAQNTLLLEHVNEVITKNSNANRNCHYVCAMVLYFGKDRFFCVQETLEGILIDSIEDLKGEGGFGYDPIVLLRDKSKTIAELTEKEKNDISHRGKATRKLLTLLDTLN